MSSIADKYKREIRRNLPIEYCGLMFYPLTVENYALFSNARPAFELMQASLSPKLARLSWFGCLDAMDREIDEHSNGFLRMTLLVIAEALRLKTVVNQRTKKETYPIHDMRNQTGELKAIMIGDPQNPILLSMQNMDDIRQIIAAQNCYEIPNENWNPDLVRATQYTASLKDNGIVFDLDTLVASVANGAGVKTDEVWDWPIKEFIQRQAAIDRRLHYEIFTQASMSGFVTFKHGNPYPTWKLDKKSDLPGDFVSTAELDAGSKGLLGTPTQQFAD